MVIEIPTFSKTWVNGIAAGLTLSFAGAASVICSAGIENISIALLVKACIFPIGLMLIAFSGFSLFTGNVYTLARLPKLGFERYLGLLSCSWLANCLGCIAAAFAVFMSAGHLFPEAFIIAAEAKVAANPFQLFTSGMFANMCVCLAVALAHKRTAIISKSIYIFLPIMLFIVMGWEHSIANMFTLTYGMLCGAEVGIVEAIARNLVPVTLGNFFGGWLILLLMGFNNDSGE